MKKLNCKSKAGFTLLEVLLAVVILLMASTMIMQGFIAVMVIGKNNRAYAVSGENNYRLAMNTTLSKNATATNQIDNMTALADGDFGTLTAGYVANSAPGVSSTRLSLIVDVDSYSDDTAAFSYTVAGDVIDDGSVVNNRFAFFYDFGDYMNRAGGHIMRFGYTLDPTNTASHGRFTDPVYDSSGNVVAYGDYGWYCFNETHTGNCRTQPYTSTRLGI